MEKVVGLCKRRGFIFQSAEIYGGFRSTYDYGPLGVNLLRNVKNLWWESMVQRRTDVVGLDAAILDTSRGLRATHPELASEFTQLHLELKANTSRADALRNFANRTNDTELRKFTNLLIDTERFGTSVGPALKTHARYLRIRFRQIAQEKARKVGIKLIFPVFFLIFPSVILVTLGPALILLFTQMKTLLGN